MYSEPLRLPSGARLAQREEEGKLTHFLFSLCNYSLYADVTWCSQTVFHVQSGYLSFLLGIDEVDQFCRLISNF